MLPILDWIDVISFTYDDGARTELLSWLPAAIHMKSWNMTKKFMLM